MRGNNNGTNVVFRQACVREFSSRSERARAAGAATATGWLLKLEGWAIGYLGNRRENHSILLAAYHARGESSSQKTLRCILSAGPSLPSPRVSSLSLSLFCALHAPHRSQNSLVALFSRPPVNPIVPTRFNHHKYLRDHRPSAGASIINNFAGSS